MLSAMLAVICIASVAYGTASGKAAELSCAVLDGASGAVTLTLTLCGAMCLWCGIMELMRSAGLIRLLTRAVMPLLRIVFPDAARSGCGVEDIAANISANILGIGNAATPYAIAAMKKLDARARSIGIPPGSASDDMITLAVLNTSSISLIPTTVCALRRAAGAAEPFLVVPAVWICSAVCSAVAVILCRGLAAGGRAARKSSSAATRKAGGVSGLSAGGAGGAE